MIKLENVDLSPEPVSVKCETSVCDHCVVLTASLLYTSFQHDIGFFRGFPAPLYFHTEVKHDITHAVNILTNAA